MVAGPNSKTSLPDYLITLLPDYLITLLPDYLITLITLSPDYLHDLFTSMTSLPSYPFGAIYLIACVRSYTFIYKFLQEPVYFFAPHVLITLLPVHPLDALSVNYLIACRST